MTDYEVVLAALRYASSERLTDLCTYLHMTTREAEAFRQHCVELYLRLPEPVQ